MLTGRSWRRCGVSGRRLRSSLSMVSGATLLTLGPLARVLMPTPGCSRDCGDTGGAVGQSSSGLQQQTCACRCVEQVDFSSLRVGQHPVSQHGSAMRDYSKSLLPQRSSSLEQTASRRRLLAAGVCQLSAAAAIGFLLALSLLRLSDSSDCTISELLRGRSWRGNLRSSPSQCVCTGLIELSTTLRCHLTPRSASAETLLLLHLGWVGGQQLLFLSTPVLIQPLGCPPTQYHSAGQVFAIRFSRCPVRKSLAAARRRQRVYSPSAVAGVHRRGPLPRQHSTVPVR